MGEYISGLLSQGGSVRMRDSRLERGRGLPQLWGIADFYLSNERDSEEASGSREELCFSTDKNRQ